MSGTRGGSPLSLPSAIICTTASRSTLQVLDVLFRRTGSPCDKNMVRGCSLRPIRGRPDIGFLCTAQGPIFMSGAMLFMHVWGQKRVGRMANVDKDIEILQRAVLMLGAIKQEYVFLFYVSVVLPLTSGCGSQNAGRGSVRVSSSVGRCEVCRRTDTVTRDLLAELVLAVTTAPAAATAAGRGRREPATGTDADFPFITAPSRHSSAQGSEAAGAHTVGGIATQQASSTGAGSSAPSDTSRHAMFGFESLEYGDGSTNAIDFGLGVDQPTAADAASQEGGLAMPDLAFMDDTLSMWNNAPTSLG